MAYFPFQPGQQPMSSSQGVVIASNQSPVSVAGTVNIAGNPSVSGTLNINTINNALPAGANFIGNIGGSVVALQGGTQITSLVSTVPSSVLVGTSIFGQLPAGTAVLGSVAALQGTTPWLVSSVYGNVSGSVVAFQGAGWSGSVAATISNNPLNVAGSIAAFVVGNASIITIFGQSPSIVGTYAEDAASATGDKGFLVMGARNDSLASVTSADGDYSSHVVGPAGELIAENAPLTKWISGTASALGGTPVTGSLIPVIAAQGASIFTYITGVQIANASANNAWVTLLGGTNSVIGYTVAPANGGSNIYYENGLKTNANAAFSASVSAVSSVYISAQGFISKT